LIKHREHLILTEIQSNKDSSILILESDKKIETPFGILFFDEADAIFNNSGNQIYVDKNKIQFPLELRLWKEGDSFSPMGMKGKKKISKYLKDEKLSLVEKENTWVLTSEDNIIWVIGKRADERFKVTEVTNSILKIKLN